MIMKLIVVGSIGIDTIETPTEKHEEVLGGSCSYACVTAALFARTGMVGVVGTDFPQAFRDMYRKAGIDLEGLREAEGRTFRWSGVYEENMDNRHTISTELNVFEHFSPELPADYQEAPFVLLGNISPDLQLHVLDQVHHPEFVMADTMDLWIDIAQPALRQVISRVQALTLNESEARLLTGRQALIDAARELLAMGPDYVLIKKGEHGSMLFSEKGIFIMPAFPVQEVKDPTGAGDMFAGGLMGYLASIGQHDEAAMRKGILYGSVAASFGVEAFSLDHLDGLTRDDIEQRAHQLRDMTRVD